MTAQVKYRRETHSLTHSINRFMSFVYSILSFSFDDILICQIGMIIRFFLPSVNVCLSWVGFSRGETKMFHSVCESVCQNRNDE